MNEEFMRQYGDIVLAYKELEMLLGKEKAKKLLDKALNKTYARRTDGGTEGGDDATSRT